MSCGDPHEIDCRQVLEDVYLYLDGELDNLHCAEVRSHLDECSPCLRLFGIEQEVKSLVARCCGNDVAPPELRERVMATLRSVQLEIIQVEFRAD